MSCFGKNGKNKKKQKKNGKIAQHSIGLLLFVQPGYQSSRAPEQQKARRRHHECPPTNDIGDTTQLSLAIWQ